MLTLKSLHAHLAAKPQATGEETFGPGVYAYKVAGKVFAILGESDKHLTLKCDPVLSEHMRAQYAAISPGYHTNKRLWITIRQDKDLPDAEVKRLIDHAYDQVRSGLTRKARAELDALDAKPTKRSK